MKLLVTEDDISQWFRRKGRLPKCLGEVLSQLVKSKVLQEKEDFVFWLKDKISKQNANWTAWGYQVLVSSPVRKLTRAVISKVQREETSQPSYIMLELIQSLANSTLEKLRGKTVTPGIGHNSLLFSQIELCGKLAHLLRCDFEILLMYMESERMLHRIEHKNDTLYKFKDIASLKSDLEPITDAEKGAWELSRMKHHLEDYSATLQSQVAGVTASIKEQLLQKNRLQAKRYLRKRKLLDKKLQNVELHLNRLESILDEIYSANTNQMVLQAYQQGTAALKQMNSLMPADVVEKTMDDLASAVSDSKELSDALLEDQPADDSADLEQELDQLLKDDENIDNLLLQLNEVTVSKDELPSNPLGSAKQVPADQQ